ncbi:MAG: RimK/LysX family protein [Bacteroidota bacterium]
MITKPNIKLIGRREFVDFPLLSITHVEAKIDTGAYTSSIHCKDIKEIKKDGKDILQFKLLDDTIHSIETFTRKHIKNSFGEKEERYVIKTLISIGKKRIQTTVSLSDRGNMRYPVLIGRRLLKAKFIVDVNLIYTNGLTLKKLHT